MIIPIATLSLRCNIEIS